MKVEVFLSSKKKNVISLRKVSEYESVKYDFFLQKYNTVKFFRRLAFVYFSHFVLSIPQIVFN